MARVTKDTTIGEVIQIDAGVIPILMGAGMHCVGCPSSAGETLEEAAMVHGIDSDMLVEERATFSHQANIKKAKGCLILKRYPIVVTSAISL